jgi:hypothetical protein
VLFSKDFSASCPDAHDPDATHTTAGSEPGKPLPPELARLACDHRSCLQGFAVQVRFLEITTAILYAELTKGSPECGRLCSPGALCRDHNSDPVCRADKRVTRVRKALQSRCACMARYSSCRKPQAASRDCSMPIDGWHRIQGQGSAIQGFSVQVCL